VDRGPLHSEAEVVFRQLLSKYGAELPDDVRSILSFYQSCRLTFDRAAKDVLGLKGRFL
jgi:hypothetical protein